MDKNTYFYPNEIYNKLKEKNLDKYSILAIRTIIKYFENKNIKEDELLNLKKLVKSVKSNCDNFVPTNEEILKTLSKLNETNKIFYRLYLFSGIRKIEGKYIINNLSNLQVQKINDFIKINMSLYRKTKNSFFCYIPKTLWFDILNNKDKLSINSLEMNIKRKGLIPIKYCRKWFYTKCIELGIPEAIADFYQGRTSNGIGSNHYLAKQNMADNNYNKLIKNFKFFC